MSSTPPAVRTALRKLPLAIVWLLAAWPLVLWLVHRSDPVAAVELVQQTQASLWSGLGFATAGTLLVCLVFPPAPAWLRRTWHRTWIQLTLDRAPLLRALSELRHFASASRHAEVGRLLRLRGDAAGALQHLDLSLGLDRDVASTWHQLGLVLFPLHEWQRAAVAFQNAEQLDPGHAFGDALLHLGRCQQELGDPAALATLRAHQQRHGGGPRSHVWLADALLRAGDRAGAVAALREAAAPPRLRLTAEENWFRAIARVRLWGKRGTP